MDKYYIFLTHTHRRIRSLVFYADSPTCGRAVSTTMIAFTSLLIAAPQRPTLVLRGGGGESSSDLLSSLQTVKTRLSKLEDRLKSVETSLTTLRARKGREGRHIIAPVPESPDREESLPPRRWILSDAGKLHREASVADAALPLLFRRTGCNWAFGKVASYRFLSDEEATAYEGTCCSKGCDLG